MFLVDTQTAIRFRHAKRVTPSKAKMLMRPTDTGIAQLAAQRLSEGRAGISGSRTAVRFCGGGDVKPGSASVAMGMGRPSLLSAGSVNSPLASVLTTVLLILSIT